MASPILSVNSLLANENTYGNIRQAIQLVTAASTASNTNAGQTTFQKMGQYTIPTLSGATYYYLTSYKDFVTAAVGSIPAQEVTMGTLTVSGNSFASGSAMPTRTIQGGSSTALSSTYPAIVITATLTATTPVITVTYTNQAGTGSRTATITLPSNSIINSVFLIEPHLQSGDTGIKSVQNISTSAGSAGTLAVVGLLPLTAHPGNTNAAPQFNGPLQNAVPMYPLQASDVIGFYRGINATSNTAQMNVAFINLVAGS